MIKFNGGTKYDNMVLNALRFHNLIHQQVLTPSEVLKIRDYVNDIVYLGINNIGEIHLCTLLKVLRGFGYYCITLRHDEIKSVIIDDCKKGLALTRDKCYNVEFYNENFICIKDDLGFLFPIRAGADNLVKYSLILK